MANFPSSQSKITLQKMLDKVVPLGDVNPVLVNIGGFQLEPFITICTDVYREIVGVPFPHKWNEKKLPLFYTNSFQQDYALVNPDNSSFFGVEWLERGMCVEMTSTQLPKPWGYVECGRQLPQVTGTLESLVGRWNNPTFTCNTFPNYMLYYGTWGAGNYGGPTLGNNPGPGSSFTDPRGVTVTNATWVGGQIIFWLSNIPSGLSVGGNLIVSNVFPVAYNNSYVITGISGLSVTVTSVNNPGVYQAGGLVGGTPTSPAIINQGANPIAQIRDPNGNLQVVTTYGTCGNNQPTWPASDAAPGTQTPDGTVVWTVVDPYGVGIRILPVPDQTGVVFQFHLVGQMPAIEFTKLSDTIFPLPDKYEPYFRQGIIAQCYRYSPIDKVQAKFEKNWKLWLMTLNDFRAAEDRELEENRFSLERGIMGGGGGSTSGYASAAWPFNSPR
jgi:hypothetical protein